MLLASNNDRQPAAWTRSGAVGARRSTVPAAGMLLVRPLPLPHRSAPDLMPISSCDAGDLAAASRGDEAAFARLFRAHQPLLLRYLRPLAGAAHEDVAAETWIQVVRGLRDFEGDMDGFRGGCSRSRTGAGSTTCGRRAGARRARTRRQPWTCRPATGSRRSWRRCCPRSGRST